ncbi:MAG TPA: alpha/beta hydrolase [Ferruginibacter sp.]|nr:alpha/beta hydrolase [Ferruginibacter sp.]
MCTNKETKTNTAPVVSFVAVEPGVKLELLDWGGKGEPLLFLAGLGNTAHVFEEFAPQFTNEYHVMALTRRGFGASSQPGAGYDAATLAKDILTLIDSLKIERITLIGHSIAGEEMTKFAGLYPTRVNKLVYLDAAADRTALGEMLAKAPAFPQMKKEDSASISTVQKFMLRVYGIRVSESELRAGAVFAKDGRYVKDITADSIYGIIMAGIEKPNYKAIQAPALSFFAEPDSVRDMVNFYDELDSAGRNSAMELFTLFQTYGRQQIDKFKAEVKAGQVIVLPRAHHYVFVSNPKQVSDGMRKFLKDK